MSHRSAATVSPPAVRQAIELARCPWIRPLVRDYTERFGSVAPLFAGNPADPAAWHDTIARVRKATRQRSLVAETLMAQLERRQAPAEAREAAAALARDETVAIVTGQQAGVFGGPLYTVLKAVTAIQTAEHLQSEYGVRTVPVFWIDAEDHDWEEIRAATILDAESAVVEVALGTLPGAGSQPVGSLTLDDGVEQTLADLRAALPRTEFTDEILAALARRYHPGATIGAAFAGWIEDLFGRHGLVVFDAADPSVKPAVSRLFVRELQAPARTAEIVHEAGAVMAGLGHAAQVDPADDAVSLFYVDASGRRAIKRRDGRFTIGESVYDAADLVAEAHAHPERFSPNVVLRPLVQDELFPTVAYVAGPSELAYQAQLGGVYREFGVEAPLLFPRASATLLDPAAARFLERHDVPFEALQAQDEAVLNRLLQDHLPPSIDRAIDGADQHLTATVETLREAVATIDPTLVGAVDTTADRIRTTLKHLQSKIVHASKKKDETLRRQFTHARGLAFPHGHPQERVLNVTCFANRYGPAFVDRLLQAVPRDTGRHYLLSI